MADFPRRMRDWLFNIMRDMAERRELTPHYLAMEREAESNLTRRWANAAVWKWCDLDAHDNDRCLLPTAHRLPLLPLLSGDRDFNRAILYFLMYLLAHGWNQYSSILLK